MADKHSVLKVDVDDAAFERFKKKFDEFSSALKSTNSEWSNLKKMMSAMPTGAAGKNGGMSLGEAGAAAISMTTGMYSSARSAISGALMIARGAVSIGTKLLQVATFGSFGVGAIGYSAFDRYRTATGLGVTPGALSAFSAYYSPYVNGGDVLGRVAQARNDLSMRPYLSRLGVGQDQLRTESNDQIAADITQRAAQMWRNGPQTQQFAEAMGLTQFFSMADLRRLGNTSDQQLSLTRRRMAGAEDSLNFSPHTAQVWSDFVVQLRKAGVQIDTVLIKGLEKLATPLGNLSDAIVKTLDALLSNPQMGKFIDDLGQGIQWLGAELVSPQFRQGISVFADNLGVAGQAVADFARSLGLVEPSRDEKARLQQYIGESGPPTDPHAAAWLSDLEAKMFGNRQYASQAQKVQELERKYNLPSGMLFGVWGQESNFGMHTRASSAGAIGPMQLMPDVYRHRNIDPNDFGQSSDVAANMLSGYMKKYHDPEKALAAYNWGPGNVDADIAAHGVNWKKFLPSQTQGYIPGVQRYQSQEGNALNKPPTNPRVNLSVTNSTSARMAVTAATVAH